MENIRITKPIIGISCGDTNGIGIELIIKTFSDSRMLDFCTPVIFAHNKVINFYRKSIEGTHFNFTGVKELDKINHKQVNIFNCWEEEVNITPGELNETGGRYAVKSLLEATSALRNGLIDALVTAPIHKKNVVSPEFSYTGHTPFFKSFFEVDEVLMFMVAGNFRVGLVTEHLPVAEVAKHITTEGIVKKLMIMNESCRRDFNVGKPKIAVLALNPHAGDEGLIGNEEETTIKPALKEARHRNINAFGPYPADAFFARGHQDQFDAVLAMYHDQGLIPFKSLAKEEGVNFTAGMRAIRTSPDHGTAFDIAGKDKADESSFRAAVFSAIDIYKNRMIFDENHSNPLKSSGAFGTGEHSN